MSQTLDQPPPLIISQPNYAAQSSGLHGSVGPVIAVLVVVGVLGVAAAVIGRVCTGRRIMGRYGKYDMESWAEAKCSSCIDGRIHIVSPVPRNSHQDGSNAATVVASAAERHQQESESEVSH